MRSSASVRHRRSCGRPERSLRLMYQYHYTVRYGTCTRCTLLQHCNLGPRRWVCVSVSLAVRYRRYLERFPWRCQQYSTVSLPHENPTRSCQIGTGSPGPHLPRPAQFGLRRAWRPPPATCTMIAVDAASQRSSNSAPSTQHHPASAPARRAIAMLPVPALAPSLPPA